MSIENFGVFRDGGLLYASISNSMSFAERQAETFAALHRACGISTSFEVNPICWSVERGEFIAVPDSISV